MNTTSISTKFILITFAVALVAFGAMGAFIVEKGAQSLRNSLDSKGNSVADLASRQGEDYLANFNFIAVDRFVEDVLKDPEVSYVAFYNEKGEKVSKHPVPEDVSAFIVFKREMQDTDKKPLGSFHLGYKQDLIKKNVNSSIFLISVSIGAAIFLFLTAIVILVRGVTRRLREAVSVTSSIAQGDLGIHIIKAGKDEIGELMESMRTMATNLKRIVIDVRSTAANVAGGSRRVSGNSAVLSQGASDQGISVDDVSKLMEKMASSISTVTRNAESLAENVERTSATTAEMAASIEQVGRNAEVMAASVEETSATIEEMLASLETTARNTFAMTDSVGKTSSTVENMLTSIVQISGNTDSLKGMVGDTSAMIEEMTRMVKEVAQRVDGANALSQQAYSKADEGGKAIYQSIESLQNIGKTTENTMEIIQGLGKRSTEIGSIISVIDEIADQTNLLALNAAIEAARAGDAGRGFAVVAEEIRKLAERSMEATKEIGGVVKQVQGETAKAIKATEETYREGKGGIALAGSSREAFSDITQSIKKSSEVMKEMAQSAAELDKAIEQVMKFVVSMNLSTEEVAKAVSLQADGAGSIRLVLDAMNKTVNEVNMAAREQSLGGRQIREAVERMKTVVQEVGLAVKEQVTGTKQIVEAIDVMRTMTYTVTNATKEQKSGVANIIKAMENVTLIASKNIKLSEEMVKVADETSSQVDSLNQSVSVFKTGTTD